MNSLKFILQYALKPRSVGAILPSSKYLAKKMVANVDFCRLNTIVEYGPGTGVFTEELIRKKKPDTKLILLERNEKFAHELSKKYAECGNVSVFNDTAEKIGMYLAKFGLPNAELILSGLPFASLPLDVSEKILEETVLNLSKGGCFVTFQYSLIRKDFISKHFGEVHVSREFRNIPPAYVFFCRK